MSTILRGARCGTSGGATGSSAAVDTVVEPPPDAVSVPGSLVATPARNPPLSATYSTVRCCPFGAVNILLGSETSVRRGKLDQDDYRKTSAISSARQRTMDDISSIDFPVGMLILNV